MFVPWISTHHAILHFLCFVFIFVNLLLYQQSVCHFIFGIHSRQMKSIQGFAWFCDFADCNVMASKLIRFEDVCASSVTIILSSEESRLGNVVGYTLWHRKADDLEYPVDPTCTLFAPNTRFLLSDLIPATEYLLKVVSLDSKRELGVCELRFQTSNAGNEPSHLNAENLEAERSQSLRTNCSSPSNRPSMEDEIIDDMPYSNEDEDRGDNCLSCYTDNIASTNQCCEGKSPKATTVNVPPLAEEEHSMRNFSSTRHTDVIDLENKHSSDAQMAEDTSTDNGSNTPPETILEHAPYTGNLEASLPITPYKTESMDFLGRKGRFQPSGKDVDNGCGKEDPRAGSSSKKRSSERFDKECGVMGDKDFEYYVKVIRWLECSGHIEMEFRQKFLTWYSLRATPQEVRVVKAFVDTLIEDPESLAGQLVHSFSDVISNKKSSVVAAGFCLKLWH